MKELIGIHHVTAITSNAKKIYDFFTNILGMRLVKKTVNQDDINTYHLFCFLQMMRVMQELI